MKLKLREKTKYRIVVLLCAILIFAIRWLSSAISLDYCIEQMSRTGQITSSRAIAARSEYNEVSTLCMTAICIYSLAIAGYIYFDYREKKE